MALTWVVERPLATTMVSASDVLPLRSIATTSSALASSRLSSIVRTRGSAAGVSPEAEGSGWAAVAKTVEFSGFVLFEPRKHGCAPRRCGNVQPVSIRRPHPVTNLSLHPVVAALPQAAPAW